MGVASSLKVWLGVGASFCQGNRIYMSWKGSSTLSLLVTCSLLWIEEYADEMSMTEILGAEDENQAAAAYLETQRYKQFSSSPSTDRICARLSKRRGVRRSVVHSLLHTRSLVRQRSQLHEFFYTP